MEEYIDQIFTVADVYLLCSYITMSWLVYQGAYKKRILSYINCLTCAAVVYYSLFSFFK